MPHPAPSPSAPKQPPASPTGTPQRRSVLLTAATICVLGVGAVTWMMWPSGERPSHGTISVVNPAIPSPSTPAPSSPLAPTTVAGGQSLQAMQLIERQLLVRSSSGDPDRAATIKQALTAQRIVVAGRPVTIDDVLVLGRVCEIQGSVNMEAASEQQSLVDALTGPAIREAVTRIGLSAATNVSVNKKGDNRLDFTLHANIAN